MPSYQDRQLARRELADLLLSLSGGSLNKKQNKGYLVLERKTGASEQNKNAVSLIREGVSFMLPDWAAEDKAKSLNLHTIRSKTYPRLIFPDLTSKDVSANLDFFTNLVQEATRQAERLQSAKGN
jgi:hypothetical protein